MMLGRSADVDVEREFWDELLVLDVAAVAEKSWGGWRLCVGELELSSPSNLDILGSISRQL